MRIDSSELDRINHHYLSVDIVLESFIAPSCEVQTYLTMKS